MQKCNLAEQLTELTELPLLKEQIEPTAQMDLGQTLAPAAIELLLTGQRRPAARTTPVSLTRKIARATIRVDSGIFQPYRAF